MKEISPEEFMGALTREAKNNGVDFINVCTNGEYVDKHIAGVRSVPLDTLHDNIKIFSTKKQIFVHCMSGHRGKRAIEDLERLGITAELINMQGGLMAWEASGLPVEKSNVLRKNIPLMRQVLLTAGAVVTLGVLLALFVHPAFVFLSLFIGVGEMFAGLTGWCGLSLLLERMPWNK